MIIFLNNWTLISSPEFTSFANGLDLVSVNLLTSLQFKKFFYELVPNQQGAVVVANL